MRHRFLLAATLAACSAEDAPAEVLVVPAPVASTEPAPAAVAPTEEPAQLVAVPPPPCPSEMVEVGAFCVDRHEAHLRVGTLEGAIHPHHRRPVDGERYVAASASGVHPQGYISRVEAAAACDHAGKRLCSRTEWLQACRGTPAPATERPCNHGKAHLLTLLGRGWDYEDDFNDPTLLLTPSFLAKTGERETCRSDAGTYDMVGNLHEWVSDEVTSSFLQAFQAEGVRRQFQYVAVGNGVFMGGFFSTRGELGPGCQFTTVAHDARYHDYSTGFRCCQDTSES